MRHMLLFLVFVAACDLNLFGPEADFVNRRPMDPVPDFYPELYAEMEACLGVDGDFQSLRLFVAGRIVRDGVERGGWYHHPDGITMQEDLVGSPYYVSHEFGHHILQSGDEAHLPDGSVPCQKT